MCNLMSEHFKGSYYVITMLLLHLPIFNGIFFFYIFWNSKLHMNDTKNWCKINIQYWWEILFEYMQYNSM